MKDFELEPLLGKKISKLSGGERQRMTLFLVLYKNPRLLIMDELTTGLDYQKRQEILYTLKNNSVQKTILTVTHYFEEINEWANKLLILQKGHMVFWGEVQDLYSKYQCYSIVKFPKDALDQLEVRDLRVVEIDRTTYGAVTVNKKQADGILEDCMTKHIQAQNELKDMYVLYILALNDYKERI